MTGTLESLIAATAFFVVGHFLLSSIPVRTGIIKAIGATGFQAGYGVLMLGGLVWMTMAYGDAPYEPVWTPPDWARHVTYILTLIGLVLAVVGLATRSPTSVGGEKMATDPQPVRGIVTVTRHPFLVGVALWALGHLLVNDSVADMILFGGLLILCIGGPLHIDSRRKAAMGAAWAPIALTTSIVPFWAVLQGRSKVDWSGIGLPRVAAGLAVYVGLAYAHPYLFGVQIIG